MLNAIAAYEIRVSGIVQGVWFRKFTRDEAIRLGITGWVRNEPNGDVLIFAQGLVPNLQSLIEWCHSGPEKAVVASVAVTPVDITPLVDFVIYR